MCDGKKIKQKKKVPNIFLCSIL